ncbi:LSU ribosomal protein L4p (L1e) [Olavius algarvensis associated proteobacterium Delta 3]|nr:LSU ribosomal protein L4p (L1e) [Olavius algarvensis associated proteobacterium Delta 3]CAB5122446.1 LSU ribosomal protein L4p (L1e) [Olavius algarvensis associated proteobacterium Delta 3]
MASVDVLNISGETVSTVELSDDLFNVPVNTSVLHQVVRMQLAKRRAGTASVKNRSEIRGSSRKLFRQKGTGRARRGNVKSPLLRGGGVAFGPKPKSWEIKVPKKVRKLALKMALSSKYQGDALRVLDRIALERIKTKDFVDILGSLDLQNLLIVTDERNENLELSSRNVPGVKVLRAEGLNVYDVLKYKYLVLLEASIKGIEGRLMT